MTEPLAIVLVGGGQRARAWLDPLRRSTRLRPVATVQRGDQGLDGGLPNYRSIAAAASDYPEASFAVALPPRSGLDAAVWLAEHERAAIVEAPLHERLAELRLPPAAAQVRVAHGWVTLPGARALTAILQHAGSGSLRLELAGLPETPHGEISEQLVHAAALLRSLLPEAAIVGARRSDDGGMEVSAASGGWHAEIRLLPHGHRLSARLESTAAAASWAWEHDRETVTLGQRTLIDARRTPAAEVRALAQLLPGATRGDDLADAAAAVQLAFPAHWDPKLRIPRGQVVAAASIVSPKY